MSDDLPIEHLATHVAAIETNYRFEELRRLHSLRLMYVNFGMLCLAAGFVLFLLGTAGVVDFGFSGGGFQAKLSNAAPGLVLALFGLMALWMAAAYFKPSMQTDIAKTMLTARYREGPLSDLPPRSGTARTTIQSSE